MQEKQQSHHPDQEVLAWVLKLVLVSVQRWPPREFPLLLGRHPTLFFFSRDVFRPRRPLNQVLCDGQENSIGWSISGQFLDCILFVVPGHYTDVATWAGFPLRLVEVVIK